MGAREGEAMEILMQTLASTKARVVLKFFSGPRSWC